MAVAISGQFNDDLELGELTFQYDQKWTGVGYQVNAALEAQIQQMFKTGLILKLLNRERSDPVALNELDITGDEIRNPTTSKQLKFH